MNRDQIIAKWNGMTPRERDAWVAEVVFGWRRCDVVIREDLAQTVMVPPDDDGRWAWAATYDEYGCPHWLPRYTEDISAAWTVFERTNRTYWFAIMRIAEPYNSTGSSRVRWVQCWV